MLKFKEFTVSVNGYEMPQAADYGDRYRMGMILRLNTLVLDEGECERLCVDLMKSLARTSTNFNFSSNDVVMLTEAESLANEEAEAAAKEGDEVV